MAEENLIVRGAREHNLQNVDVEIPRDKLTVITGLSGSGKSSLAFDTIYAEGQRRYVESLSAYARQFLGMMEKPDVDSIEGLSPAISIEQKTAGRNPRSTVGTVTEVYDYLRLLWARAGTPHCPSCGRPVERQSATQIVDRLMELPAGTWLEVLAPVVRGRKGEFRDLFEDMRRKGFTHARTDGGIHRLEEPPALARRANHDIGIFVERKVAVDEENRSRIADAVETALRTADGVVQVVAHTPDAVDPEPQLFSEHYACAECGINIPELEPRQFSFNSPYGACPACGGLGTRKEPNPDLVLADPSLSILEGVVLPWGVPRGHLRGTILQGLADALGFDLNTPWQELPDNVRQVLMYGVDGGKGGAKGPKKMKWAGIVRDVEQRYRESSSDSVREMLEEYMSTLPCGVCHGARLRPESLAVTIGGRSLGDVVMLPVAASLEFFDFVDTLPHIPRDIAGPILKEVRERLSFLVNVGLEYLTLGRSAETLSGGEAQRIRLATQIGSRLVGVLYILDEPSIGLHQRDNQRLLETLGQLRDLGNTVLVVEHDEDTIRAADYVLDLGPRAGRHGGRVIAAGTVDDVIASEESLTGAYLRGERRIEIPSARRAPAEGRELLIRGAREHNLRDVDVRIPLGTFVAVTGVSGSGKSTLINDILWNALARKFYRAKTVPGSHEGISGLELLDKIVDIDQSPIGRTPRSNPATYTGLFTVIRELFAELPESKMRGYTPGRFSFNVKGGRCEACQGDGLVKIEMHFLPDVYVPCEVCRGRRYNRETLEVFYKGHSIADVLDLTVDEACEVFDAVPRLKRSLQTLSDVGLGYIHLGQSATTLSGGEAQRVKLASELSKVATGQTFYILDEPTTGLHFEDVRMLLEVLHRLVERGNTVLVIEHNLDVIKTADWIIDLGPEGGPKGGEIVAAGPPELVAANPRSHTGRFLAPMLGVTPAAEVPAAPAPAGKTRGRPRKAAK
ncbi:excinuclease ABC subunit UvrA [Longimicrobium sp.]|uniref:excinuclease ABC subunit UvrA n=1 Tax=Longimicrobium sp. TaxID=2029185 RepID=UPI002E3057D2|nr:excinuclease ABC subunit UvrA [Longimicrobium sp.]HEX6042459.1 excinuclease ABC subunit UvrA [Longimicrobium sp.]